MEKDKMNIIFNILTYTIWLPLCLLLIGGVMLWAILYTGFNHITGIGWGLWLAIIVVSFYILFPLFALHQTYTNPNFGNKYGTDFNLEEVQEKIKKHQKEQKEKWTTDHK